MSNQPWDFGTARQHCRKAAQAQELAEGAYHEAAKAFAEKEERYRKALAVEIVKAHADGIAWSTAPDIARGDDEVARLRRERDIAEGVREAMSQALWRHVANRKDAQRFADWSQRARMAEDRAMSYTPDQEPEPRFSRPIGAKS